LQTALLFDQDIQLLNDELTVLEDEKMLPPEEIKLELVHFSEFKYRYELLFLKYSRGYPIEVLEQDFLALINTLESYKQHPKAEDFFFNSEQDEYMQAVTLVSLALLLHVDLDVFRRLASASGANGQDYVLEWLIGRRLPDRPPTMQLLFPRTYARLRDAIQAPLDLQPPLLRAFLAGWYESLNTVWYNIHAHGKNAAGFTGYWCWEAAAAAYALGLDDTELQTMRYYPKDLADYAYDS
jgi:hypothetical protein